MEWGADECLNPKVKLNAWIFATCCT
jgi:hypothetical protein